MIISKNVFIPISLTINTPDLFDEFANGLLGFGYDEVLFLPGAHPDMLSLPKHYATNTSFVLLRFEDEDDNVVTVFPRRAEAVASFMKGENLTQALPIHYLKYSLYVTKEVELTSADYSRIFNWRETTGLTIRDAAKVANVLSDKIDEMKSLVDLKGLSLTLHDHSYAELDVSPFLLELPSLQSLHLNIDELTYKQAVDFINYQIIPDGFKGTFSFLYRYIEYERQ